MDITENELVCRFWEGYFDHLMYMDSENKYVPTPQCTVFSPWYKDVWHFI
jgi:hypothetical protein